MTPHGVLGDERPECESDGAAILDALRAELLRYIVFPDEHAAVAYTLWIAATHRQDAWDHATRFVFKSPTKRCGKTRALEIGRELVYKPKSTANISPAALARSIDADDPPTLVHDEVDTIFGKRKDDRTEDLRGILNAGHARGWPYTRWDPKARQEDELSTFAMALLGGIGDLPDTIEDRAVVVVMQRRGQGDLISPFRSRKVVPVLRALRDQLHAWTSSLTNLAEAEPSMPVDDRDADKWEPLIAIADAAGSEWPGQGRLACKVMCAKSHGDEGSIAERLLSDLHRIWEGGEGMATSEILHRLNRVEEAPWPQWKGSGLTPSDLAQLLRPFGIRPRTIRPRIGPPTAKGYREVELRPAWDRYVTGGTPTRHADEQDESVTAT